MNIVDRTLPAAGRRMRLPLLGLALPLVAALSSAPCVVEAQPFVGADFQQYTAQLLAQRERAHARQLKAHGKKRRVRRRRHVAHGSTPPAGSGVLLGSNSNWPLPGVDDDLNNWPLPGGDTPPGGSWIDSHDQGDGTTSADSDGVPGDEFVDNDDDGNDKQDDSGPTSTADTDQNAGDSNQNTAGENTADEGTAGDGQDTSKDPATPPTDPVPEVVALAPDFVADDAGLPAPGDDVPGPTGDPSPSAAPFNDVVPVSDTSLALGGDQVPEPNSLVLAALGSIAAWRLARRARRTTEQA